MLMFFLNSLRLRIAPDWIALSPFELLQPLRKPSSPLSSKAQFTCNHRKRHQATSCSGVSKVSNKLATASLSCAGQNQFVGNSLVREINRRSGVGAHYQLHTIKHRIDTALAIVSTRLLVQILTLDQQRIHACCSSRL